MRRCWKFLFALTLLVGSGTTACWAQDASLPGPSQAVIVPGGNTVSAAPQVQGAIPLQGVPDENYRLGTGDKMKITVYDEPDLSGEFLVDGAGLVQFPLVGQVHAAGLSVHEFVGQLAAVLGSQYLRDPKISIEIENFRPFFILGEVNKPGEYPYENGLNVLGAVALAGGFTYRANDSKVFIRRKSDASAAEVPASGDTRISPGDVVRIPERMF